MLGVGALAGSQATRHEVMSRLPNARLVHVACHAGFDAVEPLRSGITLADGALTAAEVMAMRLDAELVVLSACESGLAGSLGGDELAGLALAFMHAGARALVVSLWRVDDAATSTLMRTFYERLRRQGPAPALGHAATSLRRTHEHPYFWAPFAFIGDWK